MKIQVLSNGFVASHFKYDKIIDRINPTTNSIEHMLDTYKPDVLINCIGYAGTKNIDSCEEDKVKTFSLNTTLPILLAEACEKKSIKLVHISSGCVFYTPATEIGGWKEGQ